MCVYMCVVVERAFPSLLLLFLLLLLLPHPKILGNALTARRKNGIVEFSLLLIFLHITPCKWSMTLTASALVVADVDIDIYVVSEVNEAVLCKFGV